MQSTHCFAQPVSDEQWMELGPALFGALGVGWKLAIHLAGDGVRPVVMKPEMLQAEALSLVSRAQRLGLDQVLFALSQALQMQPEDVLIEMHNAGKVAIQRDSRLERPAQVLASLEALSDGRRDAVTQAIRGAVGCRLDALARVPAGKPMAEVGRRLAAPLAFHGVAQHGLTFGLCCALATLSDTARMDVFAGALNHELARVINRQES
jgi:hypothetical protein